MVQSAVPAKKPDPGSVSVARPEGSYYILTVTGSDFGDRVGSVNVMNADGFLVPHVNPISWSDTTVVVEVTDDALAEGGLKPGNSMVELIPVPGQVIDFVVPLPPPPDVPPPPPEKPPPAA